MGNFPQRMLACVEEHMIVVRLVSVLNHVIKNKTNCSQNREVEVVQMEKLLELARSYSVQTPWETLVDRTLTLAEECILSLTFNKIIRETNATHTGHLFTLYALFVDVVSQRAQNNIQTDVSAELWKIHNILRETLDSCVVRRALALIQSG